MADRKYYWYSAAFKSNEASEIEIENCVTEAHPFALQAEVRSWQPPSHVYSFDLLNWKEITAEEYFLHKHLER